MGARGCQTGCVDPHTENRPGVSLVKGHMSRANKGEEFPKTL